MASESEPPHISMKEAVNLARWKPAKNQTRNDLLVYGGWLTSRWEWSRDIDVSLDQAIANARRLGEDVRVVGNPKTSDRRKVVKRKRHAPIREQPAIKIPERPPLSPLDLLNVPPAPPIDDVSESQDSFQPPELQLEEGNKGQLSNSRATALKGPLQTYSAPDKAQASHLLLQRFLIAAAFCSVALFLGYYKLAGSLFVSILLMADALFIVVTSVLALRNRMAYGGRRRQKPVSPGDAKKVNPQAVG